MGHDHDDLSLSELLRRAHRPELERLAQVLNFNTSKSGLGTFTEVLAKRLRRRGGHGLANLLIRGGDGPTYGEIVRNLARRQGLGKPTDDLETLETAIAERAIEEAWSALPRKEVEELLGPVTTMPALPDQPRNFIEALQAEYGLSYRYVAVTTVASRLLFATGPMAGCVSLFGGGLVMAWVTRFRDERITPAIVEIAGIRQMVRHRVTVGVVGSPSSGKDAAIGAIFGVPTGNVSPVAGSTKEVSIQRLPGATALYVVNTPGLGDVIESVTTEAKEVLDHIDVYVYVVNAQGGVQARELADWKAVRAKGRPALAVVNKIDTLREDDRERFVADVAERLGLRPDEVLPVAFDPLPQLSETPIGIDGVQKWIEDELVALGKDAAELPWNPGQRAIAAVPQISDPLLEAVEQPAPVAVEPEP